MATATFKHLKLFCRSNQAGNAGIQHSPSLCLGLIVIVYRVVRRGVIINTIIKLVSASVSSYLSPIWVSKAAGTGLDRIGMDRIGPSWSLGHCLSHPHTSPIVSRNFHPFKQRSPADCKWKCKWQVQYELRRTDANWP